MDRDTLLDELRKVQHEVVAGERKLAEQESLLIALKGQNEDTTNALAVLEQMRESQRRRDEDRQRLLSLLQP